MLSLLMKFSSIKIHLDSVVELYTQQVFKHKNPPR